MPLRAYRPCVSSALATQMAALTFRISRCARRTLRVAVHRFQRDPAGTASIGTFVAHRLSFFGTAYTAARATYCPGTLHHREVLEGCNGC